ncbi:hypothetical protein [Actinoallomurus sp. CA-142502]|uniref:hypothetical protein n=1 Tax=Actinoallomurus sp. CA-142502 TaxID=3239885 RepID=UPI003D933A29
MTTRTQNRYQEAAERHEQQLQHERTARQAEHGVRRAEAAEYRRLTNAMNGAPILYPVQPSRAPSRCWRCWQALPDLATGEDPRDGQLRQLCRGCHSRLSAGLPVELTDAQLAEAWEWLAHQHINQRAAAQAGRLAEGTGVTDAFIEDALNDLAPHLTLEQGWHAVEELEAQLLAFQDAERGDVNYDQLDPEWRDGEAWANRCRALVEDALRPLVGGRS